MMITYDVVHAVFCFFMYDYAMLEEVSQSLLCSCLFLLFGQIQRSRGVENFGENHADRRTNRYV
jgi:hypothetical protein